MILAIQSIVVLLAIWSVFNCGYLLLLTAFSRRTKPPSPIASCLSRRLRFDVIVPAHNEQLLIKRTVSSLLEMDWPRDQFRVVVVADNCTDETAALARAAGAEVIERRHRLRGKGYALEYAFAYSRSCEWSDAVVVVDADTDVSPNLLAACAARIFDGANAVQVHYGVRNPNASWRTRLMCVALTAFHRVRSRARETLNVSAGIRGNGWCVTHEALKYVPYRAFSLAEDIEFGIKLGLAGFRVHYADEAFVNGDMVPDAQSAGGQRRRWEFGRFSLIRTETTPLLGAAVRRLNFTCLDLAMDLLVLPLSYVALSLSAFTVSAVVLWMVAPPEVATFWLGLASACIASLTLYVLRGWQLSGTGLRGLTDLIRAPFFVIWKVGALLRGRQPLEWVRTRRSS